jgi:hypothetical protein
MNSLFFRRLLIVTCASVALSSSAIAEKGGKDKGGGHPGKGASQSQKKGSGNRGGPPAHAESKGKGPKKFETSDRSSIQRWYRDEYSRSGSCPPGLAKKNNGCMPPGQARKWNVGSRLPADIHIAPLPVALRSTLVAPLPGYDYGYVGGEVILFGVSDRVVVDVVAVF